MGLYPVLSYRNIQHVGRINCVVCLSAVTELSDLRKQDRPKSAGGGGGGCFSQLRRYSHNNGKKFNYYGCQLLIRNYTRMLKLQCTSSSINVGFNSPKC